MNKEIEIPKGYQARIEGNKVIFVPKESEDEKIRKELLKEIEFITPHDDETDSEGLILPSYHARIDRYKSYLEKQKEQKPESCDCSRDEESYTNGIHHVLMNPEAYGLIKLKPAKWSEEDEEMIDYIIHVLSNNTYAKEEGPAFYTKEINWLKSIRPVNQKWSDDDEIWAHLILKELEKVKEDLPEYSKHYARLIEWFTCRFKSLRPQPHWKPSEEQMKALLSKLPVVKGSGDKVQDILESLYNDLKKLM